MTEESPSAILVARSQTEKTRSFIKKVRCITRRRYTPEEKIRIVWMDSVARCRYEIYAGEKAFDRTYIIPG